MSKHPNGRVGCHYVGDYPQFIRCPPVIAIQERHNLSLALRNSGIKRRSLASIGFADQADLRHKPADDRWRAILRTVVHDNNLTFRGGEILFQNTGNRLLNKTLVIVRVD